MRVQAVTAFRYRVPLTAPLNLGPRTIDERVGVLVRIETAQGAAGWGDVAPLPGFSPETLDEAIEALDALAPSLMQMPMEAARRHVEGGRMASSVRFGVELALWDAQARAAQTSVASRLGPSPRATVAYNGLLTGEGAALRAEAARLEAAGYPAIKLKVGRQSVGDDIARVRAVRDAASTVALRLDANRAWTMDAAQHFAAGIDDVPIAYIEEPLADPTQLASFAAETGVPVALDETMQEGAALADHSYATAAIVKPTLVGGVRATQRLAREAEASQIHLVLSASFESGIGLRGLVALAATIGTDDVPVGLDTYSRLRTDVVQPRLPLYGPVVDVLALMEAPLQVNPTVVDLDHPVIAYRSPS